jgi:uncharacterized protein YjbI with pentapeptide repeats
MGAPADPVAPDIPEELASWTSASLVDEELDGVLAEGLVAPAIATGLQIAESRVVDTELSEASMERAVVRDVGWAGGSLANARLGDARITRSRVEGVRATGLDLTRCSLDSVVFVDCRLDLALFRASSMDRVRFEGCRLEDADFFEASFSSVVFEGCDLRAVNWAGASFSNSELRGCEVTGGLSLERLRGVRMPWDDVIRSAGEIAIAAGIEIVE